MKGRKFHVWPLILSQKEANHVFNIVQKPWVFLLAKEARPNVKVRQALLNAPPVMTYCLYKYFDILN